VFGWHRRPVGGAGSADRQAVTRKWYLRAPPRVVVSLYFGAVRTTFNPDSFIIHAER